MKKPNASLANASLAIALIERDMLLQPRATLHRDWIEEYALDMASGATFPPIVVYFDGEKYWLGDGFHRTYAAEAAGCETILADVRKGTRRDALLHSVSANADHGHRRTNDDKRRAVDIMLNDPDWAKWSDSEIARRCAVSQPFVLGRRPRPVSYNDYKIEPRLVTRGGTTYEMNTAPIGAAAPAETAPAAPANDAAPAAAVQPYDWEASRLYTKAFDAIRDLASLPEAADVIAAWMKSRSYGEPIEVLEKASEWLAEFLFLYDQAEPVRWAAVQRMVKGEVANAAE